MFTPGPNLFSRKALKDHYIKDVFIKKGSIVIGELYTVMNNRKYFNDPEKLIP
jgi:cytochrome P450